MALLNPGYWQSTYWPSSYWHEDYWQDYALTLTVENLIHDHSLSEVILFQNSLLIVQALLHAHTILGEIDLIQTKPKVAENFSYKFLKLKILPYQNLSDWFLTLWFSDWFGEEVFTLEHQIEDFKYRKL